MKGHDDGINVDKSEETLCQEGRGALWKMDLVNFTDGVSVVGLKYVFHDGFSWLRRSIWLLLVLGGFAFMMYQLQSRISYYLSYPTNVKLEINYLASVPFPTVTLCSENRMSRQSLLQHGLYQIMEKVYPPWIENAPQLSEDETDKLLWLHKNSTITDLEYALTSQDRVFDCAFNGKPCHEGLITDLFTPLGVCQQFNANGSLHVEKAGSNYGLQLFVITNQSDYGAINSPVKGYRVLIHDHTEFPVLDQHGLYVPAGNLIALATTIRNVTKLSAPFGDCKDEPTYRRSVCLEQCKASYVVGECGCAAHYLPHEHLRFNRSCSFYDKTTCLDNAMNEWYMQGLQSNCICPQQCNHLEYDHNLHLGSMSDAFAEYVIRTCDPGTSLNSFLETYARIDVYMSALTSEEITSVSSYTMIALLCDVGGALGLILGSTILTVFEFADFCIASMWTGISVIKSNKKNQVRAISDPYL